MKPARLALIAGLIVATSRVAVAQDVPAEQFVMVPLRVHVLNSPQLDLANCRLTDADVARVVDHINAIWHKAGIHFGVESIVREDVEQRERFRLTIGLRGANVNNNQLLMLLPRSSRTFDGLHVYYFHVLPYNTAFVGDDVVFAREAPELEQVPDGGDDPIARVTSHALGNALGLPNHGDPRNLMGGGTTGIALNTSQAETAREVARTIRGAMTVTALRQAAKAAMAKKDIASARRLAHWLAEVSEAIEAAEKEAKLKAAWRHNPDRDQVLIVPLRVHVMTDPHLELANCKLTDADIARVVGNINAIWRDAGIRFSVESILREPAEQRERFRITTELGGGSINDAELRMLLPRASRTFDGVHVYYFHELPFNSAFLGDDIVIAKEEAQVRQVKGGGDDAVARVTAHALGNLLGLTNDPEPRNLMAGGTPGVLLDDSQAETAYKLARTIRGVATAAEVRKAAEAAEAQGDAATAHRLRSWLAEVPGPRAADPGRRQDNLTPSSPR